MVTPTPTQNWWQRPEHKLPIFRAGSQRPMTDQTTSEIATYFRVCDRITGPVRGHQGGHRHGHPHAGTVARDGVGVPRVCGIRSVRLAESWRSTCPDSVTPTSPND